jgi:hypothetical protein
MLEKLSKTDVEYATSFSDRFAIGMEFLRDTIDVFTAFPAIILPISFSILTYFIVIYLLYWDLILVAKYLSMETLFSLIITSSVIFSICFSVGTLISLEVIKQIAEGNEPSLISAVYEFFTQDLLKAIPIISIWMIFTAIVTILYMLIQRLPIIIKEIVSSIFDLIMTATRLFLFLIYPAIIWEEKNTFKAINDSYKLIRNNKVEFCSGIVISTVATFILEILSLPVLFILVLIVFFKYYSTDGYDIQALKTFLYIIEAGAACIIVAFSLFIEQMFSTLLYIWIKTWRKEVFKAALEKKPIPKLIEIEKPDFFNLYRYGT